MTYQAFSLQKTGGAVAFNFEPPYTDIEEAPWYMVGADVKRHARLNCIHHLLQAIPWQEIPDEEIELPDLQKDPNYRRPPIDSLPWVPEVYGSGATESG